MSATQLKIVFTNIRTVREYRNYSQSYLALKLGITQNAYSKIELGYTDITLKRTLAIAEVLDVHICDLIQLDIGTLSKVRLAKPFRDK